MRTPLNLSHSVFMTSEVPLADATDLSCATDLDHSAVPYFYALINATCSNGERPVFVPVQRKNFSDTSWNSQSSVSEGLRSIGETGK